MDLLRGLAPRHRAPLRLPGPWPACAQALLRAGASWLHGGGPGGWGGDLLALPGGPELRAAWDGGSFRTPEGRGPWEALSAATSAPHPWVGAATFELACWEAGLPFRAPVPGNSGMAWRGLLSAIHVSGGRAEAWGWGPEAPDPEPLEALLASTCTLGRPHLGALVPAWPESRHTEAVETIRRRIHDGGFYVANLCVPFEAAFDGDLQTLALARFRIARPPFGALLPLDAVDLLCLSMERLLARDGDRIWTEPIKGSTPHTGDADADARLASALREDPKERAEHTMIVDLLRNDLGRVAEPGSVDVGALMEARAYPTVQHLVSTISARVAAGRDLADLLRAVLPGGSVTGAPKHAVCDHLATLEAGPRGYYCGALGWIGPGGRALDLALPIRTAQVTGNRLTYWTGGGITRRSEAAREWAELFLKTRVLTGE